MLRCRCPIHQQSITEGCPWRLSRRLISLAWQMIFTADRASKPRLQAARPSLMDPSSIDQQWFLVLPRPWSCAWAARQGAVHDRMGCRKLVPHLCPPQHCECSIFGAEECYQHCQWPTFALVTVCYFHNHLDGHLDRPYPTAVANRKRNKRPALKHPTNFAERKCRSAA